MIYSVIGIVSALFIGIVVGHRMACYSWGRVCSKFFEDSDNWGL